MAPICGNRSTAFLGCFGLSRLPLPGRGWCAGSWAGLLACRPPVPLHHREQPEAQGSGPCGHNHESCAPLCNPSVAMKSSQFFKQGLCVRDGTKALSALEPLLPPTSVSHSSAAMAERSLETTCVSIALEDPVCNSGSQDAPLLTTHLKKVENHITDAQRFSHLPKRSAVDIEFVDLSYSVREGSWWRKRGKGMGGQKNSKQGRPAGGPHWKPCLQVHSQVLAADITFMIDFISLW